MDSEKAMGQDPTFQKRSEFPLDETGNRAAPFGLPRQKGFQMCGDGLVEKTLLGIAGLVGGGTAHALGLKACGAPSSRNLNLWRLKNS